MSLDYLFIRLLEACNAGCFMCDFADSKDKYRLGESEFEQILDECEKNHLKYIRFTGGEPLMHKDIVKFIEMINERGMKSSIITNGSMLEKMATALADAGLDQIIVSIDGPDFLHDEFRKRKNLFNKAMDGLKECIDKGIVGRVNTVIGPDNFRYMSELQNTFTEMSVSYWELSSLKLEKKLDYSKQDQDDVEKVINDIFVLAKEQGKLIPSGKIWCGETKEERDIYFQTGNTPSPDNKCHIVDKVRYYDAKNKALYACSLIPHRPEAKEHCANFSDGRKFELNDENIQKQVDFFKVNGPSACTGCSTTAAGCSNLIDKNKSLPQWYY